VIVKNRSEISLDNGQSFYRGRTEQRHQPTCSQSRASPRETNFPLVLRQATPQAKN